MFQWEMLHCSLVSHSHPAEMSSPQGSRAAGQVHWQLYVRFLVMLTAFKYIVVELYFLWLCSVGGWSLYMDPLHLHLKVQYTWKLEPRCTTGPAVDQMAQDFSPERRNDDCVFILFVDVNVTTDHDFFCGRWDTSSLCRFYKHSL